MPEEGGSGGLGQSSNPQPKGKKNSAKPRPDWDRAFGPERRRKQLYQALGKAGAHALFPKDFEYYLVTLELVDSQDKQIDYLAFPVTPDKMNYTSQSAVNVQKTLGGVSSIDTGNFVPRMMDFSGSFGRKFKILLAPSSISSSRGPGRFPKQGPPSTADNSRLQSQTYYGGRMKKGKLTIEPNIFLPKIKTGYGTLKILERILENSKGLDEYEKPYKLYLYNPALGHSWLVTVKNFDFTQDVDSSNMIWKYNVSFHILAPLQNLIKRPRTSLIQVLKTSVLQQGASRLFNDTKRIL